MHLLFLPLTKAKDGARAQLNQAHITTPLPMEINRPKASGIP